MPEEDPFARLRNSSPLHAAIITPDGTLIIHVLVSGDGQSLTDFQPVALEALGIAAKHNRHHGAPRSGATGRKALRQDSHSSLTGVAVIAICSHKRIMFCAKTSGSASGKGRCTMRAECTG
jgi:hypothetical protein